jgi:hypothetical protein
LHLPPRGLGEAKSLEQLRGALPGAAPWEPQQTTHEDEVLVAGEVFIDRGVLSGEADFLAHDAGVADDVVAEHRRGAGVRPEQRGQNANGRRLARPVRAQQAVHRALTNTEVYTVQGAGGAEALYKPVCFDRIRHWFTPSLVVRVVAATKGTEHIPNIGSTPGGSMISLSSIGHIGYIVVTWRHRANREGPETI